MRDGADIVAVEAAEGEAGGGAAGPSGPVRLAAAAALAGWAATLCAFAALRPAGALLGISFWELQRTEVVVRWLGQLAAAGALDALRFVPVGLLAAWVAGRGVGRSAAVGRAAAATVLAFAAAWGVRAVERGGLPVAAGLLLPAAGCVLGLWTGRACLRGPRAAAWLAAKLGGLVLAAGVGAAALVAAALEDRPLPFTPPAVTTQRKRQVVRAIRSGARRRSDEPSLCSLRLAEGDIDFLLAWGLSLGSPDRKASVRLEAGRIVAMGSAAVPTGRRRRWVNVRGELAVGGGPAGPEVEVRSLRVGRLGVPRWILAMLADAVRAEVRADPTLAEAVGSVRSVAVRPGVVEVVYAPGSLDRRTLPSVLERLGARPDVAAATRRYVEHLVAAAPSLPRGERRFGAFLQRAFTLAMRNSRDGSAAVENRAALYALAILLGHPKVERLVGPVTDEALRRAAGRSVGRVTLRGRSDWVRHFLVSAALTLASAESVSDAAGLLKEELDAAGGSGFSFADLLADRAGTRFAQVATDEATAGALQRRLAGGFRVEDFFPPAADLPEGLSDRRLREEYGGVNGPGYRRMLAEMDRRLSRCAGLR